MPALFMNNATQWACVQQLRGFVRYLPRSGGCAVYAEYDVGKCVQPSIAYRTPTASALAIAVFLNALKGNLDSYKTLFPSPFDFQRQLLHLHGITPRYAAHYGVDFDGCGFAARMCNLSFNLSLQLQEHAFIISQFLSVHATRPAFVVC